MYWTIKINLPHAIILSPISTHCSKISFSFFHLFPFPLCEQLRSKRSWRRNFCPLGKEKIIQAWKKVPSWKTKKLQTIKKAWDCHEKKGISMKMLQRHKKKKTDNKQQHCTCLIFYLFFNCYLFSFFLQQCFHLRFQYITRRKRMPIMAVLATIWANPEPTILLLLHCI